MLPECGGWAVGSPQLRPAVGGQWAAGGPQLRQGRAHAWFHALAPSSCREPGAWAVARTRTGFQAPPRRVLGRCAVRSDLGGEAVWNSQQTVQLCTLTCFYVSAFV